MMQAQIDEFTAFCKGEGYDVPTFTLMSNGAVLIEVGNVGIQGQGWNRDAAKVLFVAPPGYPAAQPDCFWVEPANFRIAGGGTPQASNDANPIPSDTVSGRVTTWFSWHLQSWNPSKDSLVTYFNVIKQRLVPSR
jgi:hypothetical protein